MAARARRARPLRTLPAVGAWLLLLLVAFAPLVAAAGPPFPDRATGAGAHVVDEAEVLPRQSRNALDESLRSLREKTGTDIVIFLQVKPSAKGIEDATADAQALLDQWGVGGELGDGAVLILDFDKRKRAAFSGIAGGAALVERVGEAALESTVADAVDPSLAVGAWAAAVTQGVVALTALATSANPGEIVDPGPTPGPGATARPRATPGPGSTPRPLGPTDKDPVPPAGPPWPDPLPGVTVYDYAHVLDKESELFLAEIIASIEDRTGSEVAVYTQVKPDADTPAEAEADARSLMDQWGVGRRGFDDGLVILFDLDESRCGGQVQLYAGPGFRDTFLTNEDRDALFRDVMLPALRACDLRTALIDALGRIDLATTPERARSLQVTRQVDAVTGLVVAPLLILGLVGWASWSWLRFGRDPEVADDASVLMPAPPDGLSPAAATVVTDGRAGMRALTTALVDLASRGEIRFRDATAGRGRSGLAIEVLPAEARDARTRRERRGPLGAAEQWLLEELRRRAGDGGGLLDAAAMERLGELRDGLEDRLEHEVAAAGWFREPPERSVGRWSFRGAAVLLLGILGIVVSGWLPSAGVLMLGWGAVVSGIALLLIARAMPQRTLPGARIAAWLEAYRRTLRLTMERSRTMDEVVARGAVPWLTSADQAAVWSYALGLQDELQALLGRSVDVAQEQRSTTGIWMPDWYPGGMMSASAGGTSGMSSLSLPSFAGMAAALGTIGLTAGAASGGSGGSGGFSGGGSGGGGGGAGGGF